MADTSTRSVMSFIATSSSRIRDLVIKDSQLIFIRDLGRIAFDFKGERVFYNQIVELNAEADRLALESPLDGYYLVLENARLWLYKDRWIPITNEPQEIVQVGVELPQLGRRGNIYATTKAGAENISIWDDDTGEYVVVADKTQTMTSEDVIALFNQ